MDELPETLDGTYEQTLRRIDKQKRDYAYRLFQCLVVSKRQLHVEELAELFAIQPNAETIPTFDAGLRPENPEEYVLSACSTLVVIINVHGRNIVQFSHFSVREYLISNRIAMSENVSHFHVLPRPAHVLLARACLSVLLQLDDRVGRDNIRNFPLASYAAEYWVDHAQFENVSSDIRHEMEGLFDKNKPHFAAWLWLYNIDNSFSSFRFSTATVHSAQPYAVPLYYAALCGFRDTAEHLVNAHPQDVNALGGMRVTPLYAALEMGHLCVAMLLVERGADMESRDYLSRAPLHIASYHGYTEVVTLLIDHGADLNAEEFYGETPLHRALEKDHDEIVRLLLDHGADANHPDNHGRTPLHQESLRGHNNTVRLLFDHFADANHPDNYGRTSLHYALQRGHNDTVQLLLDHGADVNHPDNRGRTPLRLVLEWGQDEITRLLSNHGADSNYLDNRGGTPLRLALERGQDEIVRLLFDHGANVNHPDNRGRTPLQLASESGRNDTVRLLLDHGAVVNHPDNRGLTPLHLASLHGRNDIVQLLLDHSAVANHPDNLNRTPLDLALEKGHSHTAHLLLDHGAVANHPHDRTDSVAGWPPQTSSSY